MKPVWAKLFSAADNPSPLRRDRDSQIKCPVVAFYSLKGGLGRTTALVNTAIELGDQDVKVLCLDMDLEAPSLPDHFSNAALDDFEGRGLAALLSGLTYDPDSQLDLDKEVIEAAGYKNVWYMPAGRVNEAYINAISSIDPLFWGIGQTPNPLSKLVKLIKDAGIFDVILIDSRTGLNSASASVLAEVSDMIFVGINPHPQSRHGTGLIVKGIQGAELVSAPSVYYFVSPLTPESEARETQLERVYNWLEEWGSADSDSLGQTNFSEITAPIDYLTEISTSTRARDISWQDRQSPYTQLAAWVLQKLPEQDRYSADEVTLKGNILEELEFTRGVADSDPSNRTSSNSKFIETDFVRKAKMENTSLVIGRKGTGKTAIFFNLLSESSRIHYIPGTAPAGDLSEFTQRELLNQSNFELVQHGFSSDSENIGWRRFWLALLLHAVMVDTQSLLTEDLKESLSLSGSRTVTDFVASFRDLTEPELRAKLDKLDSVLTTPTVVMFDGLDSVFGSTAEQLKIRKSAVEGLLDLSRDLINVYSQIGVKVFLRRDLWDQSQVQNKTHLRAASVELEWSRIQDFMRLGVAYAIDSSPTFAEQVRAVLAETMAGFDTENQVAYWPDEAVKTVWDLIFGERMQGGRTAFTHKWVWLRTADANGAHAPRDLLMLLDTAKQSELEWHRRDDHFQRCLIRPRALMVSIEKLSHAAISSLGEEFPELDNLISELPRFVRNSPFEWSDFVGSESIASHDIRLACEVGLIEKPDANGTRGRIPDLYRHGLGIGRKGQT